MKYKLINSQTGETHLCDKVTIDGFDYYVSDELPKDNDGYWIYMGFNEPLEVVKSNQPQGWFEKLWDKANYKTPIATNNPNIDIPKVVDEVEKLAFDFYENVKKEYYSNVGQKAQLPKTNKEFLAMGDGFMVGYNKSQETHSFSEEDIIEFLNWIGKDGYPCIDITKKGLWVLHPQEPKDFTPKELLQLWKEQQTKIVYYES